ncbi:MAG: 30S ribosomal protein S9 [bacterium]|nr:30S ribosomal protein S9 [bacterium]HBJ96971.1 30S ribosomal protein S9 [Lentisphaeria bacterium]
MSTELRTTGRRKCASARVVIAEGSGKITVNGKAFEEYFNTEALRGYILQPLAVTGFSGKIDVKATVAGGGKAGQAGAVRHGIARALVKHDEEACKAQLKANGMLTRDAREKERKKPGQPGARRRFQFSKR